MAPDARRWFAPREGEGAAWTVSEAPTGPWSRWDAHFHSRGEVVEWRQDDSTATAIIRETNDYYDLLERGPMLNRLTYGFDEQGLLRSLVIGGIGERNMGLTDEFRAWAQREHPDEIAQLMPNGEIDPSGDHPERFRALLNRWRAETGRTPIESVNSR